MNSMKKLLLLALCALTLVGMGCIEEGADGKSREEKIDKTMNDVKNILDKVSTKASKFLEEGEMDKLKDVIDKIGEKSKEVSKDGAAWKIKLEELKNNPEIKELLEKHKGDADEILKEIQKIAKDTEEKLKEEDSGK